MTAVAANGAPARPAGKPGLGLALRLARREFRSGLVGFRVFLGCLTLGVAAIAGVGSVAETMLDGLRANGREILGGEIELRLTHRPASAEERAYLESRAEVSELASMRTMARKATGEGRRVLVELRAADDLHPLFGELGLAPNEPLQTLLAKVDGRWGAALDPGLLTRLGVSLGDSLRVGDIDYEVRAELRSEPDRAARGFVLGPSVLVARASLAETGLEQPGSLIRYYYRLDLAEGVAPDAFRAELSEQFPEAGWRIRGTDQAAPGLANFINRLTQFLTLVGLTTLLVGGVGISNAVRGYLDGRATTIATLKCLGAPSRLIHQTYLLQILVLALGGTLLGLVIGALAPLPVGQLLGELFGFQGTWGLYPGPLALGAAFGLLTAFAFSLWPLARARAVPAAHLFRDRISRASSRLEPSTVLAIASTGLALAGLAIWNAEDRWLAFVFVAAACGILISFHLAARALIGLAKRAPRSRNTALRLAIANLHRPGAPSAGVVVSLGLGLTVLVAIAEIEGNLAGWVEQSLPDEAPAFYFIDIQPDQVADFESLVQATPGVHELRRVPMLRGRIAAVNGTPSEQLTLPDEIAWVFRGDRGLTWTREPPEGTTLTAGDWWPADYSGEPLVSLSDEVGRALGIGPGDRLSVNILGRDVEVTIANLRRIEWSNLTINFVMVFSPGLLEAAPQTHIATVKTAPEAETPLEQAVTERFANITAIRVRDAVETFSGVIESVAIAVRAVAAVALLAGIMVLAGAIAAGQQRRIYDAVVLKVLGATRAATAAGYLLEFALLGLATALLAGIFGTLAAAYVITQIMELSFTPLPGAAAVTLIGAVMVTAFLGFPRHLAGSGPETGPSPAQRVGHRAATRLFSPSRRENCLIPARLRPILLPSVSTFGNREDKWQSLLIAEP